MIVSPQPITTGVLGGRWRADVLPWGAIQPFDGSLPTLDWHIAADDRWRTPSAEPGVVQRRMDGTAVVETRVPIPDGQAIQRVYSVPDAGGLTIIEIENASPLSIAIAFTHGNLLSQRPLTAPIEGITLPAGSVATPIGHHATITVALRHDGGGPGALPAVLPPCAATVRGWLTVVERASRLLLPDSTLNERVVAARCELALTGPEHPDVDPVGFLLGVDQIVRMGEQPAAWVPDVAQALALAAKGAEPDWALAAAFDGAERILHAAGERRAVKDLAAMRSKLQPGGELPFDPPADGAHLGAWAERWLATATATGAELFPAGMPGDWVSQKFEVYGVPTGPRSAVSFAVRWHGKRPAILWEQTGPLLELTAPAVGPGWRCADAQGEILFPELEGLEVKPPTPVTMKVSFGRKPAGGHGH